jgi:general stress protein YciG
MPQNVNVENHGASPDPKRAHDAQAPSKKSNRGFASMDASKQREIASKGGRAAHQKGTAHQFTSDEAREAGRKGGGAVSQDRSHMAEIGRIGGQSRGRRLHRAATGSEPPASTDAPSDTEVHADDNEGDYKH